MTLVATLSGLILLALCGGLYLMSRLSCGYEVTDGSVYFRSFNNLNWKVEKTIIQEADATHIHTIRNSGGHYGADNVSVFFEDTIITAADVGSFEVIDWRRQYSRDNRHVYWKSIRVSDAPNRFVILGGGYAKDGDHVYYHRSIVAGADPDSFAVTEPSSGTAQDDTHQYRLGESVGKK